MTDTPTNSTPKVRPDPFARIMPIRVAALLSTLAATLTVLLVAFVAFLPFSAMFLEPSVLILTICYAVAFSVPVTLVLLPLAAIIVRRDIPVLIILSIIGSIGGAISGWLWCVLAFGADPIFLGISVTIGVIGGLVAGVCFGCSLKRPGK